MKHLSDYIDKPESEAFKKYGAFFAFSQKQFNEKKKDGVIYAHIGSGLICPQKNGKNLMDTLDNIIADGIKKDLKENGVKGIIWRELANHECQISMNYQAVIDELIPYNITKKDIKKEWKGYFKNCVDNDYF